jgi:preprotein translocase subunit SecB
MSTAIQALPSEFKFNHCRLHNVGFRLNDESAGQDELKFRLATSQTKLPDRCTDGHDDYVVSLRVFSLQEEAASAPFFFEIEMRGHFSVPDEWPEEIRANMLTAHAPALIYSQMRPVMRLVAAEAGQEFVLPLLNIAAAIKTQAVAADG